MCIGAKEHSFELLHDSSSFSHSLHGGIWVISIQLLIHFICDITQGGCKSLCFVRDLKKQKSCKEHHLQPKGLPVLAYVQANVILYFGSEHNIIIIQYVLLIDF